MGIHTKEPWMVTKAKHGIDGGHKAIAKIGFGNGDMAPIIHSESHDGDEWSDAERIVACVNACAGHSNETLEALARGEIQESEVMMAARYKQQRDELLDALDSIRQYGSDTLSGRADGGVDDRAWQRAAVSEMRNRASVAITKAKAGAA